jgi:hypothetical protein
MIRTKARYYRNYLVPQVEHNCKVCERLYKDDNSDAVRTHKFCSSICEEEYKKIMEHSDD